MTPRVALATVAAGRPRHLARQLAAAARLDPPPLAHVVVSLDPAAPRGLPASVELVHLPVAAGARLPVGAARNRAVERAAARGADLVALLDVDCLPEPELVGAYAAAHAALGGGHLLAGPVGRLAPLPDAQVAPTRAQLAASRSRAGLGDRPVPRPGELVPEPRVERFWSLSFAVAPAVHARLGGFDPAYVGYGGEDTDYALRARRARVPLSWVGGAWAHHQHHPVASPPVEHLEAIVDNARTFRARWGAWPMEGWLAAFAERGLVEWTPEGDRLALVPAPVGPPPRG